MASSPADSSSSETSGTSSSMGSVTGAGLAVPSQTLVESQASEIFRTTMSPYCPGLLISDCPSGKASLLKDVIRSELQQGKSPAEIRQELTVRYKTELDARPPSSGFGALMWVIPLVLLCIGALVVWRWIKSQVRAD